jgi:hypothetical protein|tara:strand:+ start:320 stop:2779 length:2460 start_codon:yes stop_codon:yes gene_type:complete
MSRLIFEGETTNRFGNKFPRTFIEKITLRGAAIIDVDVSLFFQVPVDDAELGQFKDELNASDLTIFACMIKKRELDYLQETTDEIDLNNFFRLDAGTQDFSKSITEFEVVDDKIYNSLGKRFAHYRTTYEFNIFSLREQTASTSRAIGREDYQNLAVVSFSTFLNLVDALGADAASTPTSSEAIDSGASSKDVVFYKSQTGDLSYELIYKDDGTINKDFVDIYEDNDKNYYYGTPLQSLNQNYYQTDQFGHKEIIEAVTSINQKYSIEEASNISFVLDEFKDSPKLLLRILKSINLFTNKSTITQSGKLYEEIGNYINTADALVKNQPGLTRKRIPNTKIIDLRKAQAYLLQSRQATTNGIDYEADDSLFFPTPLVHEKVVPIVLRSYASQTYSSVRDRWRVPLESVDTDIFYLETQGFFFFDFEKALNYRSQISKILSPYALEQIYGHGSLASSYEIRHVEIEKTRYHIEGDVGTGFVTTYNYGKNDAGQRQSLTTTNDPDGDRLYFENAVKGKISSVTRLSDLAEDEPKQFVVFDQNVIEDYYSKIEQRSVVARRSPGNEKYRMACYELEDLERPSARGSNKTLNVKITIKDTTMQHYETYVRTRMNYVLGRLRKYYEDASEFCSYNNMDGRFNQFFVDAVKEKYAEPYPWEEAPIYYLMFSSLIDLSRDSETLSRKETTEMIDTDGVKKSAEELSAQIGPENGTIEALEEFYNNMLQFRNTWFLKGQGLDNSEEIYRPNSGGISASYDLKNPEVEDIFEFSYLLNVDDIIGWIEVEEVEEDDDVDAPTGAIPGVDETFAEIQERLAADLDRQEELP